MSQRDSGYERKERDCYETPEWVTRALVPELPLESHPMQIWEPACGSGKMVRALEGMGHKVFGSDIDNGHDFLKDETCGYEAIITNPPYVQAEEFIIHALDLTRKNGGLVAMLLRTDFDHARGREELFRYHRAFWKKLVLTKRIRWFENSEGSPSFNHAWFIWKWGNANKPILAYGP